MNLKYLRSYFLQQKIMSEFPIIDDFPMSEFPMDECPICYDEVEETKMETLHICHSNEPTHNVCAECYQTLRTKYVKSCPLCRTPINGDLEHKHEKIISDIQLLSFNFSREFIAYIRKTQPGLLPFRYYHGEGVALIQNLKIQYNNYKANKDLRF